MTERPETIPGLHHVTSIASDPRRNIEFYTQVLGLRILKKTVNFDDPSTYHLYYGDEVGHPGTALTFFPFVNAREGRVGRGQTSAVAFVVPQGSINFWRERFEAMDIEFEKPFERFDQTVLPFVDGNGHPMELVTGETDIEPWSDGKIPEQHAIRGFDGVTLDSLSPDLTGRVIEQMGYEKVAEEGNRSRFRTGGKRAANIDILHRPDDERGRPGAGTVHHIAFRTADSETQLQWGQIFSEMALNVTEQKDRYYFKSIYFREPGGVLFEIATEGPGFTRDQSVEELGRSFTLPPWLEGNRDAIVESLPALDDEDRSEET